MLATPYRPPHVCGGVAKGSCWRRPTGGLAELPIFCAQARSFLQCMKLVHVAIYIYKTKMKNILFQLSAYRFFQSVHKMDFDLALRRRRIFQFGSKIKKT